MGGVRTGHLHGVMSRQGHLCASKAYVPHSDSLWRVSVMCLAFLAITEPMSCGGSPQIDVPKKKLPDPTCRQQTL